MSVKREIVAQDVMGSVARETLSKAATPEETRAFITRAWPDPVVAIEGQMDAIADWLVTQGWPDPRVHGVLLEGDGWRYLSGTLPAPPFKFMRSSAFIEEKEGPLSVPGFAARIFEAGAVTLQAYREGDLDRLMHHAMQFGAIRAQASSRHRFFDDVERGKKELNRQEESVKTRREESFKAKHGMRAQAYVDGLASINPNLSWSEMQRKAAQKFDVSPATIKRNLVKPKLK